MYSLSPAMRKKIITSFITLLLFCTLLTACDVSINTSSLNMGASSGTTTTSGAGIGSGSQGLQIFVEPAAGDQVITNAISSAKKSVWLEMYLLTDRKIINALEEDAHNGIDVRVMLEPHPYGGGSVSPRETLDKLKAAGVKAQGTSPAFALTHEKGMIIDGNTAYIMTSNFTLAALGGNGSTKNREYGIIDTNQQEVQAVTNIFNADWNQTNAQFNDPNLVVSPVDSRTDFVSLINSAQKSLSIEAEEMQDSSIEQAIVNAARRGVQVQVILPSASSSSSDSTGDSNGAGIKSIKRGGVQVKEDHKYYMHAKIIIVDGHKAFVGSENISTSSLDKNRELGIVVADQNVLSTLQQTFQQDWSISKSV